MLPAAPTMHQQLAGGDPAFRSELVSCELRQSGRSTATMSAGEPCHEPEDLVLGHWRPFMDTVPNIRSAKGLDILVARHAVPRAPEDAVDALACDPQGFKRMVVSLYRSDTKPRPAQLTTIRHLVDTSSASVLPREMLYKATYINSKFLPLNIHQIWSDQVDRRSERPGNDNES